MRFFLRFVVGAGVMTLVLTTSKAQQVLPTNSAAKAASDPLELLQSKLTEKISKPRFAQAIWGIKVVSLDSDQPLFEYNANRLLKPASNAKLYTTALALDRLGPDYRIRTSVYSKSNPDSTGVVHGDLIVFGRGDPCFAPRFNYGLYEKSLKPLVDSIVAAGVKKIEGDLVGDDSYFKGPATGSGWIWEDLQHHYGAEASALTVDDNVIHLSIKPSQQIGKPCQIETFPSAKYLSIVNRTTTTEGLGESISLYRPLAESTLYVTGSIGTKEKPNNGVVAIHNPAALFVTLLKEELSSRGVTISGKVITRNWLDGQLSPVEFNKLTEICSTKSRPLTEILTKTLKFSQALYAQLLLLQVGSITNSPFDESAGISTEKRGVQRLKEFVSEIGIPNSEVLLQEGTGLSRDGLVTPNATVSLLKFMAHHKHAALFRNFLPVAGVDGTLVSRMENAATAKNVQAKTGTLPHVANISGYLKTAGGEQLAFSIMLNNCVASEAQNKEALDDLVQMLANFRGLPKKL
jgi:D-alanyl-D-alanine carboxypeptidase/D-alanyl-D-alanine-endopeptidase (penicillin-binding protein 4)